MAIDITREGGMLKIDNGSTPEYFPVDDVTLKTVSTDLFIYHQLKQVFRISFSDLNSPAGADIEEKADAVSILLAVGDSNPVTWGARTQITANDTGNINIPANKNRRHLRITNSDSEPTYFVFGDFAPVFEEDIRLIQTITLLLSVSESGTSKIRFITEAGKTVLLTYQEGV